jgi:hypothetical protein
MIVTAAAAASRAARVCGGWWMEKFHPRTAFSLKRGKGRLLVLKKPNAMKNVLKLSSWMMMMMMLLSLILEEPLYRILSSCPVLVCYSKSLSA